ncbi:DUF350 domain-containing protein [Aliikangiella coralliicola]|uniref:DUF350 domain-containing protein n=1 Tax=Aliikangiella coralliicola TaxID=2592383 RepID=A0A545UGC3_9GAMM|nr:DUF350 domain-containing protein [Aliikangiella coralliicola]TQV88520.1 DUF350 domain-containing protein [Aliikangiella coralliicola]
MNFNHIDIWNFQALAVDLVIVIALLVSMKFLKGFFSSVHATEELKEKNNAAFGISYAGGILALGFMLTGASSGEFADSLADEAINMLMFGLFGLVMIMAGRFIQDKFVLTQFDVHAELVKGNQASAFVDVGHMLAVGLIVRAAMIWVPVSDWRILPVLLVAFVLAQVVMLFASIYRIKLFKARNEGKANCLQAAIAAGNAALALRYAAFMVGAALAVTAATGVVPFTLENQWLAVAMWAGMSLAGIIIFAVLVMLVRKIVLTGIDVAEEVDQQQNTGVAAIEGALFVSLGLILVALFG